MTTKVIFNTDKKAKVLAMKEAKRRGLTLTYYLNQTVLALAGTEREEAPIFKTAKPTQAEVKAIARAKKEIKNGDFILATDLFKKVGYIPKY